MSLEDIKQVLDDADCIYAAEDVNKALANMAVALDEQLSGVKSPLYICIMNGGFFTASQLVSLVNQPDLQFDYLHASRYQGGTAGGKLVWETTPSISLSGRTVVLVDDIYDEGITMQEIVESCHSQGAERVLVCVLTRKQHGRETAQVKPDIIGLELPDRYVFGCGMDYKNHFRQLNAIYAVKGL